MSLTRTISSRAAALALCAAGWSLAAQAAEKDAPTRIVRPEGYIQIEPDDGGATPAGSFSITPALQTPDAPAVDAEPAEDEPALVPPPAHKTPREICQPIADRFVLRLAELRGGLDAGEPLDPAVQRAMFGRVALKALTGTPDDVVPEVSWDAELKDLRRTYLKCLKAERRR